jgi:hypothetical protein
VPSLLKSVSGGDFLVLSGRICYRDGPNVSENFSSSERNVSSKADRKRHGRLKNNEGNEKMYSK